MANEPKPGDGGAGGGTPPAPDPKPGDGKTVEQRLAELEGNLTKTSGDLQSTREELQRVNHLNSVLMGQLKTRQPEPDRPGSGMDARRTMKLNVDFSKMDPASDPQGFATTLVEEVANQVRGVVLTMEQQRNLRDQFYKTYPDLVGWEGNVGQIGDQVANEHPEYSTQQAFAETARRTREFLKSRGIADPNAAPKDPPVVIPPSNGGAPGSHVPIKPPTGGPAGPFDPDKAQAEAQKEYLQERDEERGKTLGGPKKA